LQNIKKAGIIALRYRFTESYVLKLSKAGGNLFAFLLCSIWDILIGNRVHWQT